MTRWSRSCLAIVLVIGVAGCGGSDAPTAAPKSVPTGLVPPTVQQGVLAFHESKAGVKEAFAEAGPDSLAADGGLWELRRNDLLVGVLQLTALMPEVALDEIKVRDSIVRQLLPASRDRFDVGDVTVWATERSERTTYVWFGQGLLALLTVKPARDGTPEPEDVLEDVLDHMVGTSGFEYLYYDDEVEEP